MSAARDRDREFSTVPRQIVGGGLVALRACGVGDGLPTSGPPAFSRPASPLSTLEMAADRVRCGYPRVSVFRVLGLGLVFRPRFSSSGLGLISGSVSGFGFHPWISNGYSK